jgi:hypothetical protein
MKRSSLCNYCRYRHPGTPMTCDAYPEGVPARFRFGSEKHVEPAEGDHGLQFEMAPDLSPPLQQLALQMVEGWKQRQQKPAAS